MAFWLNMGIVKVLAKFCVLFHISMTHIFSCLLLVFFSWTYWRCSKIFLWTPLYALPLLIPPCINIISVCEREFPQRQTKHLMKCEAQTFHYNILCTFAFNNYILHPRSLNSFQKWITVVLFFPEYSFSMTETALS